jgi:3-phenylpropionate/trans-cinnamate dioxygenase ferredoxin reductase subunit
LADDQTFVIVGASLAGGSAAATLRDEGFGGRLVLIGDESVPPYERPGLSKGYLRGEESLEDLFVREADHWEAHGVEARFGERVHRVDPRAGEVALTGGQTITFDRALVATGVRNRRLDVPGIGLDGICSLRTVADSDAIKARAASATKIVVVGMGFIGAEVTASLRTLGKDVTVVEIFETALYRILGGAIGRVLEAIHRDHGAEMFFGDTVERFEGEGQVERVVTRGGRVIDADLVVVGVGTEPNAEVMHGEGLASNGGIAVDAALQTSYPRVFSAGDVATHDHPLFGRVRVEHFDNAVKMGAHVARSMLGDPQPFADPHWFWSDQYGSQIQMGGVFLTDRMVLRGSLEERSFCAFFLGDDGVLRASISLDWPRDCRRSLALIGAGAVVDPTALADPEVDLRTLMPSGD